MRAIKVVPYDPSWPALFMERHRALATQLLPLHADIHHFGSTSVPGLAAKPKIDIDAVFGSAGDLSEAVKRLAATGLYVFHGDPYAQGTWTFTRDETPYGTRLYLCAAGNVVHERRMLFRDYLRAHPEAVETYAALKRRLAAEAHGNWDCYTGGKTEFVLEILQRAGKQSG